MSKKNDEEITITGEEKEKAISTITRWIARIKNQNSELQNQREDAMKCYEGKDYVPTKKGRSGMYTTDFADTVEWVLPKLIKMFAGDDEATKLMPETADDAKACDLHNEVVNYQLKRKNPWFIICNDWFRDALSQRIGVVKRQWHKSTEYVDKDYEGISAEELQAKLMEPNVELVTMVQTNASIAEPSPVSTSATPVSPDATQTPGAPAQPQMPTALFDVSLRYKVEDEYPEITPIPANRFGMPIDTTDIEKVPFCYHRVDMLPHEVIEEFGQKVLDDCIEQYDEFKDGDNVDNQRFADLGGLDYLYEAKEGKYVFYECYFPDPKTGIQMVAVMQGYNLIRYRRNRYNKPPFRVITPIKLAHRVIGKDYFDMLKQIQKIRTVILRQLLDNIYFANNGRYLVDPTKVQMDDFLNGNVPGGIIRGKADGVMELPAIQLGTEAYTLLEKIYSERENRTGVTRYSQGTDAPSLNKTFRGLASLQQAADIRIEYIGRCFAEMGVAPLIRDIVDMNIQFLKKPIALRIANDWVDIPPDDIVGRFDVIVNVGIGSGNRDMIIQQMQQLLGLYAQIKTAGVPIISPDNVYNVMKELIKAMGYRNTNDFLTESNFMEAVHGLIQTIVQSGVMQMSPQIKGAASALMQSLGMPPPPQPNMGTPPGGVMPPQGAQPAQPRQPNLTPPAPQLPQAPGGEQWA